MAMRTIPPLSSSAGISLHVFLIAEFGICKPRSGFTTCLTNDISGKLKSSNSLSQHVFCKRQWRGLADPHIRIATFEFWF
jgi:hypothetical protein